MLYLRFLLARNNFLFTKAFTHAKWSEKNTSVGRKRETKKFLLFCERIAYCRDVPINRHRQVSAIFLESAFQQKSASDLASAKILESVHP